VRIAVLSSLHIYLPTTLHSNLITCISHRSSMAERLHSNDPGVLKCLLSFLFFLPDLQAPQNGDSNSYQKVIASQFCFTLSSSLSAQIPEYSAISLTVAPLEAWQAFHLTRSQTKYVFEEIPSQSEKRHQ
jgi:hypothetical protein